MNTEEQPTYYIDEPFIKVQIETDNHKIYYSLCWTYDEAKNMYFNVLQHIPQMSEDTLSKTLKKQNVYDYDKTKKTTLNKLPEHIANEEERTQPSDTVVKIMKMTKDEYNQLRYKSICPHCYSVQSYYFVEDHIENRCRNADSDKVNAQLFKENDEMIVNNGRWLKMTKKDNDMKWVIVDNDNYNTIKHYSITNYTNNPKNIVVLDKDGQRRQLHKLILGVSENKSISSKGELYDYRKSMMEVHDTHGQAMSKKQQNGAGVAKETQNTLECLINHTRKTIFDGKRRFVIKVQKKNKTQEQVQQDFENACQLLNDIPKVPDNELMNYLNDNNILIYKK